MRGSVPVAPAARPPGIRLDAQGLPNGIEEGLDGRYRVVGAWREAIARGQIDCLSFTIGEVGDGPDRRQAALDKIAFFDRLIADNPDALVKVERGRDVAAARASVRCGLIYNFQDTSPLEGDAGAIATFAALGIRMVQLTYNRRNLAGHGCLELEDRGLTPFGREVIAGLEDSRVVLDLSHAGPRTAAEAIAAARLPAVISHAGCRTINDNPRNVADAEMRALADKGGVFGLYMMPFLRPSGQPQREDLIRHIEHALQICGEDHIGIGSDNPVLGYVLDEPTLHHLRRSFARRQARGLTAPGEAADVFNLVEGYNEAARFDRLAEDLAARGWRGAQIDKLLGDNFARLFGEVWGD